MVNHCGAINQLCVSAIIILFDPWQDFIDKKRSGDDQNQEVGPRTASQAICTPKVQPAVCRAAGIINTVEVTQKCMRSPAARPRGAEPSQAITYGQKVRFAEQPHPQQARRVDESGDIKGK